MEEILNLCDVWFSRRDGALLLVKCAADADASSGLWSCVADGIHPGETSTQGCLRICQDLLGVVPDMRRGDLVMSFCADHACHDIWLFQQEIPLDSLNPRKVADAQWFTAQEVRAMLQHSEASFSGYVEQLMQMLPILCACGKE